jgi:hypothetical protein
MRLYYVPYEEVAAIEWDGNGTTYDVNLFNLGAGHDQFIVLNPWTEYKDVYRYIDYIPKTNKCAVYFYEGEWVAKIFNKSWNPVYGYEEYEVAIPTLKWETNPEINSKIKFLEDPCNSYELDISDLGHELIWYVDPELTPEGKDIWLYKATIEGAKTKYKKHMGYLTPKLSIIQNPDLPDFDFDVNSSLPNIFELGEYVCQYRLKSSFYSLKNIWAVRFKVTGVNPKQELWLGTIEPNLTGTLDVIFISYNEPNAEHNWNRVLEKAPHAQRVDGVEGIFEAHKEAARIARTDMFYVVDGDAFLFKKFEFDFQPGIFDRDCVYIWSAKNPIADLTYGYGGVKLIPRDKLLKIKKWRTLDLATSISEKIQIVETISNWTAFNTDDFSVWKSVFRECVKLLFNMYRYPQNAEHGMRFDAWKNIDTRREFSLVARNAAEQALVFVNDNEYDLEGLMKINNRKWLEKMFYKNYPERKAVNE